MMKRWIGRLTSRLHGGPSRASAAVQSRTAESPTVLLAWELGRGMGHICRLVPVARELAARGYRVTFALRSRADAALISTSLPAAEILQAPYHVRQTGKGGERRRSAYNYADMLFSCGYESRESLEPLVAMWQTLFDAVKPALVVCDHSPTVVLAADGILPVIHIGSGFATPPAGQPFLGLYPAALPGAAEREARVLESIMAVRAIHGMAPPRHVAELPGWAESFACSLPELDPYRAVRPLPALGTIHGLPKPMTSTERNFVFGYLAGDDPRVPSVLQSLVRARVRCSLYIRQAPRTWQDTLEGTSVKLFDAPQYLNEIIGAASAVLHHGGVTTTEVALAIGRPQFLLPRYVEQGLTAEAIEDMGCGRNLAVGKEDVGECIRQALRRGQFADAAVARARLIAGRPNTDVKALVVSACLKHLT